MTSTEAAKTWKILDILNWASNYFEEKNIPTAKLDAQILLGHALHLERIQLFAQFDRPVTPEERSKIKELIQRRAKREPVAYITGEKGFWKHVFQVNHSVLIPRPDTELLVEKAIEILSQKKSDQPIKILDIGTGSGCIAISLKKEMPHAKVTAIDISPEALKVAKLNAQQMKADIQWFHSDLFQELNPTEKFDLILSNPPYITQEEYQSLEPEITQFEPVTALVSDQNGLSHYEGILSQAHQYLNNDGHVFLEIGDHREKDLDDLAKKYFLHTNTFLDLNSCPRLLIAKKTKKTESKDQ